MRVRVRWQLADVVVSQLQSRHVLGRKGNVTYMVTLFMADMLNIGSVGHASVITISLRVSQPFGWRNISYVYIP